MSATEPAEEDKPSSRTPGLNPGNPLFSCGPGQGSSSTPWSSVRRALYRTTASEYGRLHPTPETSPCSYHPLSHSFTKHLGTCGMYRNNSLNTSLDKSRVLDCINLQNTT